MAQFFWLTVYLFKSGNMAHAYTHIQNTYTTQYYK